MQAATNVMANERRRKAASTRARSPVRSARLSITAMRRQTSVVRCSGGSGESFTGRGGNQGDRMGEAWSAFCSLPQRLSKIAGIGKIWARAGLGDDGVERITPLGGKPFKCPAAAGGKLGPLWGGYSG